MKLTDIISLTKAGFKAAEIRQMIAEESQEAPQETVPETDHEEVLPEDESSGNTSGPEPKQTEAPETPADNGPDYKKMYEDSQKQLKEAQRKNINKQVPEGPSNKEKLVQMVNEFFG